MHLFYDGGLHVHLDIYDFDEQHVRLYLDAANFYEICLHPYLDMSYFTDIHASLFTHI